MTYTILVIEAYKDSLLKAVRRLRAEHGELGTPRLVLLTSDPGKYEKYSEVTVIGTDYSQQSLTDIFASFTEEVKGVICRGDKYIQYLRQVVPYLPAGVLVSSEESLRISTSKRLMRQAFLEHFPEITPGFVKVNDANQDTLAMLGEKLAFPVIIKPTSLASSLLIQRCNGQEELERGLTNAFSQITVIYDREGRHEEPEIIVEEFMEGDFYSIDSYVQEKGQIVHCPPIPYIPANQLGIDDFFLYKRFAPAQLSAEEVEAAERAAEKALLATGLAHTSAHIELVRTGQGWKIIELGPRIGRFRNIMYRQAYGFDHGYNDLLVHVGVTPEVSTSLIKQCAAYSIYPSTEGTLVRIEGAESARQLQSVCYFQLHAQEGSYVKHAKNGGHALCEVILANSDEAVFGRDVKWFEENVFAVVADESSEGSGEMPR